MRVFRAAIDGLADAPHHAVVRAIGAAELARVDEATALAWLPIETNFVFVRAVAEVLGPENAAEFYRRMTLRDFQTSVFEAFVSGARRLFGVDVGGFFKQVPAGFSLLFRDAAAIAMPERSSTHALLVFDDLAEEVASEPLWLESVRTGLVAVYDLVHARGTITLEIDQHERRASFHCEWTASRARVAR